ncbi:MAG TPA: DUF4870 domain-containing protein [Balneolales bacterium]|nr:DUF4870 domain-containing protein [Balneolales bacterium]
MNNEKGLGERQWAMLCHLGALSGFIIPFGNIIVPAAIWVLKRDESALIDEQGKESLNFQISLMIYYIIAGILVIVIVGIILLILLVIFQVVYIIKASIKVDEGESFRYPYTIRFFK